MTLRIPYYHVDAFTSDVFKGNPAGVCPLERWLPDEVLAGIAGENNLSETAFYVPVANHFDLRWFTPALEVDLCGHATLAAAWVLFAERNHPEAAIRFHTRSGWLHANRHGDMVILDFPARPASPSPDLEGVSRALRSRPREVLEARDYLAVFDSESEVAALEPDMALVAKLDALGVIATARGIDADFVSRFFAPAAGIPEDPVTGSSHSTLIPFWAERLGKTELFARQISRRGGELNCTYAGDRVGIGGRAVIYGRGELEVPVE